MNCRICGTPMREALRHEVRGAHQAVYMICPECDYMCVADAPWLKEAYEKPINATDTGYVLRNIFLGRKTLVIFSLLFGLRAVRKKTFVDYAGGYGILTRLMRDFGLDFYWDDAYAQNLFAQGFEYGKGSRGALSRKADAVTCFECFEHFVDPISEIEKILAIGGTILFSTQLKPIGAVPPTDWHYYGFNHGQHVSFYSRKTLEAIARKFDLHMSTDGDNLHILSAAKIPRFLQRAANLIVKLQADILIRKMLAPKTTADHDMLVEREMI